MITDLKQYWRDRHHNMSEQEREDRRAYFKDRYRNMTPEQKAEHNRRSIERRKRKAQNAQHRARCIDGYEKAMREARKERRLTGQPLSSIMQRMGLPPEKVKRFRELGR